MGHKNLGGVLPLGEKRFTAAKPVFCISSTAMTVGPGLILGLSAQRQVACGGSAEGCVRPYASEHLE